MAAIEGISAPSLPRDYSCELARADHGSLPLFRAVELTRIALRRQNTRPVDLAKAAGLLLGLSDVDAILSLAVRAEDACARARRELRRE